MYEKVNEKPQQEFLVRIDPRAIYENNHIQKTLDMKSCKHYYVWQTWATRPEAIGGS